MIISMTNEVRKDNVTTMLLWIANIMNEFVNKFIM